MTRLLLAILIGTLLGCSDGRGQALHGRVELVVLHTADTHSQLFPFRERIGWADSLRGLGSAGAIERVGGFARLAELVRRERRRGERTLQLDSGDAFQGSLAFDTWGGEPELLALDALGVEAQALGNHELDRGPSPLRERYQDFATFPLLAANYVPDAAGAVADIVSPFVVLDAAGLRVGVIGVGNVRSVPLLRERPSELGVLAHEAAGAVQGAVDALRPVVDLVVVVTHLGLDADVSLVRATSGVDLVLGGHQHLVLDEPLWISDCGGGGGSQILDAWGHSRRCAPRRVPVVHSGAYGKYLGRLALTLDDDPEELGPTYDPLDGHEVTAAAFELLPVNARVAEDPAMREVLEPYGQSEFAGVGASELAGWAPATIERLGATNGDSPLGNFAASAARWMARSDLALLGASSLRSDLVAGMLDLETLERSLPFDDPVLGVRVTGKALESALERVAASAAARDCRTPIQVAGALVRLACPCVHGPCARLFIGETDVCCQADDDCAGVSGACSAGVAASGRCFLPVAPDATYALATTGYLADGGGGLLQPVSPANRELVAESLRDAVAEALRETEPCGSVAEDCSGGCSAGVLTYLEQASADAGTASAAPGVACEHARRLCRSLPCLDAAAGALRDGRLRIERP